MKSPDSISSYLVITMLFLMFGSKTFSQHVIIPTGTTTDIDEIRKVGNMIVMNGDFQFITKCYDDCDDLIPLTIPVPYQTNKGLVVLDTNRFYMMSFSTDYPFTKIVSKTINGGQSWTPIFNSPGTLSNPELLVFDTNHLFLSLSSDFNYQTEDGGGYWELKPNQEVNPISCSLKINDSVAIFGGNEKLAFTTDTGVSWTSMPFLQGGPVAFFASSQDSVYLVSNGISQNYLSYFFGGFQNTRVDKVVPGMFVIGMYAVSKNEIYVIGRANPQYVGRIMKTTDLGNTWTYYDIPETTYLSAMVFLNDSIALIGGYNGTLIKWNKSSPMTEWGLGIEENNNGNIAVAAYPNPVLQQQELRVTTFPGEELEINLYDAQGRKQDLIYSGISEETEKKILVDFSDLSPGVYIYVIRAENRTRNVRFIKH